MSVKRKRQEEAVNECQQTKPFNDVCHICQEKFNESSQKRKFMLTCGHEYHITCFETYCAKKKLTQPVCCICKYNANEKLNSVDSEDDESHSESDNESDSSSDYLNSENDSDSDESESSRPRSNTSIDPTVIMKIFDNWMSIWKNESADEVMCKLTTVFTLLVSGNLLKQEHLNVLLDAYKNNH